MPSPSPSTDLENHIILCGLGRLGHRVLRLLARLGERVVIVTTETPTDWPPAGGEFQIVLGDARKEALLRQAGLERAKAVIITTNDDLTNVSIALDVRRLNPAIPVVVRLFDQQLGTHLEKSAGIHRALSTSALAAPAFVGSALGDATNASFEMADGICVLEKWPVAEGAPETGKTIIEWTASRGRTVIGLCRADSWQVGNLNSIVLQPGDVLTALRVAPREGSARAKPGTPASSWSTFRLGLSDWWHDVPRALRVAMGVLMLVVLASVVLFHWTMNLPFVDAFYFVITTITTVGYGDFNFMNAPVALKLYGSLLMLCGAALLAMLFSISTDLVVSMRFRDVLTRGCCRLRGHIIIGLGNLGFRVLRELVRNGETVVAVERDVAGKYVDTARSLAPVVLGNGRTEETLQKAGLAGAKAILALTDDDIANLSIGLAAKRARSEVWSVLRVYDAALAEKMRTSLGVDSVLSVSAEAAGTFVGAALGPEVLHGFVLGEFLVVIFRHPAAAATPRGSTSSNELSLEAAGVGVRWYPLRKEA